jgi:hypothetical protein
MMEPNDGTSRRMDEWKTLKDKVGSGCCVRGNECSVNSVNSVVKSFLCVGWRREAFIKGYGCTTEYTECTKFEG